MPEKLVLEVLCPTCYNSIKDVTIRIRPFAGNTATGEKFASIYIITKCKKCAKAKKAPAERSYEFKIHQCQ